MKDILHCDLNNFYASVEIRDNPSLSGKPVAVCGSVEDRCGIVLAKNYIAKAYGIKTADTVYEAKSKCPSLTIVPPRMRVYSEISKEVKKIYMRYTDMIEPFGIDECWLDVTGSHLLFGSSEKIAGDIKEAVKRETGLTISVGVSFTKALAKLGSDMKKPDAVTVLPYENYLDKIKNLPASSMIGIGPSTFKALRKLGVNTLGDLAKMNPDILMRRLGKSGISVWRAVNGLDDGVVREYDYQREIKSLGNSTTLPHDLRSDEQVWQVMLSLSEDVCRRLREQRLAASGISVSVKTNDLSYKEYQSQLDYPIVAALPFAQEGFRLFKSRFDWHLPVRAVGIRGINLVPSDTKRQYSLFYDSFAMDKKEKLAFVSDSLKQRFGKDIIFPARLKSNLFDSEDSINPFTSPR